MAFNEPEKDACLETLENEFWFHRRPPLDLREQIREGQRISGQSIELFFLRPAFNNPEEWIEDPITKITYVRSRDHWRIYWMRADLKWHRYPPDPEAKTLSAALRIIRKDECACFFG